MSAPAGVGAQVLTDGRAPRGAWWVAFRLQRSALLVGLGVLAVMAGLVLWHRFAVVNLIAATSPGFDPCPAPTGTTQLIPQECVRLRRLQTDLSGPWEQLRAVWAVLPALIGAATGSALFSREFDRRSQVFALTQSVSIRRWFLTKVAVAVVPLLAAGIAVGFLFESTANAWGPTSWTPIDAPFLLDFGFLPAAVLLASFAAGIAVSTALRQPLAAVLVSVAAGLGLLAALVYGYEHLTPAARTTAAITSEYQLPIPARSQFIHSGFLDASGQEMTVYYDCTSNEQTPVPVQECFARQGATEQFVDHLPLSSRARLTWTISGIAAALSAGLLALGYGLLRRWVV